jgi:hypothetical protein
MTCNTTVGALLAVAILNLVGVSAPASAAQGIQDTYCSQGRKSGYPGNCQFSNYQQCMATVSGTGETCGVNPMKAFARQRRGWAHDGY